MATKLRFLKGIISPTSILVTIIAIVAVLYVSLKVITIRKRMEGGNKQAPTCNCNGKCRENGGKCDCKIPTCKCNNNGNNNGNNNSPISHVKPVQIVDSSLYADYFSPLP